MNCEQELDKIRATQTTNFLDSAHYLLLSRTSVLTVKIEQMGSIHTKPQHRLGSFVSRY